jgi:hypothetical protein
VERLLGMFGRGRGQLDPEAVRDRMTRDDPDFAHVRKVQHDALNTLGAKRVADGLSLRRERAFWSRHGRDQ